MRISLSKHLNNTYNGFPIFFVNCQPALDKLDQHWKTVEENVHENVYVLNENPILKQRIYLNGGENHGGMLLLPLRQILPHVRPRRSHI